MSPHKKPQKPGSVSRTPGVTVDVGRTVRPAAWGHIWYRPGALMSKPARGATRALSLLEGVAYATAALALTAVLALTLALSVFALALALAALATIAAIATRLLRSGAILAADLDVKALLREEHLCWRQQERSEKVAGNMDGAVGAQSRRQFERHS